MGNIPLQDKGGFVSPVQKRGVSPDWNAQRYEYAASIVDGFNKMGQQIGNDFIRHGKAAMQDEQENKTKDAHSISMFKIKQGESFSAIERQIQGQHFKTESEFDDYYENTVVPELDKAHEELMNDGETVWNRERLQQTTQSYYEVSREQFRVKMREQVFGQIREQRKSVAASAMTQAVESGNIAGIQEAFNAAVVVGVPFVEAQAMANNGLTELFVRTQHAAMQEHGAGSAAYQMKMAEATSEFRQAIGEKMGEMLSADNAAIIEAWQAGDFKKILSGKGSSGKAGGKSGAKADGAELPPTKLPETGEAGTRLGANWEAAVKAGIESVDAREQESLAELKELVENGTIPAEKREMLRDQILNEAETARAAVKADALARETSERKGQRELIKSLILAAQDEGQFLRTVAQVTESRKTAQPLNKKLQWMRDREDKDYSATESRRTLLWIYANSKRYTDENDPDGSYRLAAFALARKACNKADYSKAIAFLNGEEKSDVQQNLMNYGIGKLMLAAEVDEKDFVATNNPADEDEDDALDQELAAMIEQTAGFVGQLHPQAFRAEIDTMCQQLKKLKDDRSRLAYLDGYYESVNRALVPIDKQMNGGGEEINELNAIVQLAENDRKAAEAEAKRIREDKRIREERASSAPMTTQGGGVQYNEADIHKRSQPWWAHIPLVR